MHLVAVEKENYHHAENIIHVSNTPHPTVETYKLKKNHNPVNPDVGTDDAKKPVKGDVLRVWHFTE